MAKVAAQTIDLAKSQSFPPGTTTLPAGQPWTVPTGVSVVDGSVTAGPMADPNTTFRGEIQLDRGDGNGFVAVAGISGNGGLAPSAKGGAPDTAVTISSDVFYGVVPGWRQQVVVTVTGTQAVIASASLTIS
jgi:hypothetical protein